MTDYPPHVTELAEAEANYERLAAACKAYLRWCEKSLNAGPVGNPHTHLWHNQQMREAIALAERS